MGLGPITRAIEHLLALSDDAGWRCRCGPELGRFRGPGRKTDPCPIANVYALKALSLVPELLDSPATRRGAEMLLGHWERRTAVKYYLFGVGGDFRKLKYPFVWYDILHVAEVLSRYPFVRADPRFGEMLAAITAQADAGRALHRRLDVPGVAGVVLCGQEAAVALADVPGAAHRETGRRRGVTDHQDQEVARRREDYEHEGEKVTR